LVAGDRRVVVWDPQGDWLKFGYELVSSRAELLARLIATANGEPARLSFRGARSKGHYFFSWWCEHVFRWARIAPATIVVEELAWVSHAGKAPDGWLEVITGALKFGVNVVSITQRPTEADKTSLSQSLVVYCFQVERADEQKYLAKELGVDVADVAGLEPLDFIRKDRRTRELTRGRLELK
jgi:hypothetical protein